MFLYQAFTDFRGVIHLAEILLAALMENPALCRYSFSPLAAPVAAAISLRLAPLHMPAKNNPQISSRFLNLGEVSQLLVCLKAKVAHVWHEAISCGQLPSITHGGGLLSIIAYHYKLNALNCARTIAVFLFHSLNINFTKRLRVASSAMAPLGGNFDMS